MCGIFGFTSKNPQNSEIILDGLRTLEYRGYDSWGAAVILENKIPQIKVKKQTGKIGKNTLGLENVKTGIGHTRWATHGGVTDSNAHPHQDCSKRFALVHNGIIENEGLLRKALEKGGHKIISQTDTELIAHLLEEESKNSSDFLEIVANTIRRLHGAFALAIIDAQNPTQVILVKHGGPLVIGVSNDEYFFASDSSALIKHTKEVVYLKDSEMAVVSPNGILLMDFENNHKKPKKDTLDWEMEDVTKGKHEYFMIKEILEQPESLKASMLGRIDKQGQVKLGGLEANADVKRQLEDMQFVRFVGSGTASYAALFIANAVQELTSVTAFMENSSELAYQKVNWPQNSAAWFISQSGETADALKAIQKVSAQKILPLGLVNVVGSSIARETKAGVYLHTGPEIAVASTKAFTSQMLCGILIACWLAQNNINASTEEKENSFRVAKSLHELPDRVREVFKQRGKIRKISESLINAKLISYFGRGLNYPIALEGALKLKEISYLDSIGMQTGDLKHGPIAAMDQDRPAIVFAPSDGMFDKNISNIKELLARDIPVFVVTDSKGVKKLPKEVVDFIEIPVTGNVINPILNAIVVQLIAFECALLLDRDIDKPRNLAKSVTVE